MILLSLSTTLVSWIHIYIQIMCVNFVKYQLLYQEVSCKIMILHWQLHVITDKLFFLQVSVFIPRKLCPSDIQLPSESLLIKKLN